MATGFETVLIIVAMRPLVVALAIYSYKVQPQALPRRVTLISVAQALPAHCWLVIRQ